MRMYLRTQRRPSSCRYEYCSTGSPALTLAILFSASHSSRGFGPSWGRRDG